MTDWQVSRRALLSSAALLATGCAMKPAPSPYTSTAASPSAPNPSPSSAPGDTWAFEVPAQSTVRVAVASGAFGVNFTQFAAQLFHESYQGTTVVTETTLDMPDLVGLDMERGGFDLIHDGGTRHLRIGAAQGRLTDLSPILNAPSLEGETIRNTLYLAALDAAPEDDSAFYSLPYVLVTHGLWYSEHLFAQEGLTPPKTWAELLRFGNQVDEAGRTLFLFDDLTVCDYLDLAITMAIKAGGDELRIALDSLADGAWEQPAIKEVFDAFEALAVTSYLQEATGATSQWASGEGPVLIPARASIVRQTQGVRDEQFEPAVMPVPTVATKPLLPAASIHAGAEEALLIPSDAQNPDGAMEFLRILFSKQCATAFTEANEVPTVVRGTSQTTESSALRSQAKLLASAGTNAFTWRFIDHYGLGPDANEAMLALLRGKSTSTKTRARLQELSHAALTNSSFLHYPVR